MAVMIDQEKGSVLRATPRLLQILRVLARHKFLGALRGKSHLPPPKEVRETFQELGVTLYQIRASARVAARPAAGRLHR